jgi:toxin ParE1/3/4
MPLKEARFISPAELELAEGIAVYESERPGLGLEFADRVEATVEQALRFPEAATEIVRPGLRRTVRRYQVHSPFPYDLVAAVFDDVLVVLAVAHHKRRPMYWRKRLRDLPKGGG